MLLQMRCCKIRDVECDNRIRLHRHRCRDHVPIFDRLYLGGPNSLRGFRFRAMARNA